MNLKRVENSNFRALCDPTFFYRQSVCVRQVLQVIYEWITETISKYKSVPPGYPESGYTKFELFETELKIDSAILCEIDFDLLPHYPKLHVFFSYFFLENKRR
jgi:hypothetical protein